MMNLKEFLEKHNIKQKDFAEQVGVCRNSIVNYIRGNRRPTAWICRRIERATQNRVRTDDLMRTYEEAHKAKDSSQT
jgi:DNA-binding XRE family transcriptional regulator